MTYQTRHDLPGSGVYADDVMIWRARQLITAGYSATDVASWIGCPLELAEAAFVQVYPQVGAQV